MRMLFIFNNTFECVKYVLQIAIFLATYKMLQFDSYHPYVLESQHILVAKLPRQCQDMAH